MNLPFPCHHQIQPWIGRPGIHGKKVPEGRAATAGVAFGPGKPIKEARDFSQTLTCSADLTIQNSEDRRNETSDAVMVTEVRGLGPKPTQQE